MSLFRCRDWWEVILNEGGAFDSQSLTVVELDGDRWQSVLVAGHSGLLRVFSPRAPVYDPSHLLLELRLPSPVLQIVQGLLVSGSRKKQVAVLHPQLVSVYNLKKRETREGIGNSVEQITVELVYQHVLRNPAHSLIVGPFGGVNGRDFICVLSLDGALSFYEQETFAFQIFLPNFLFPFGFTYLEKIDSFLFLNGFLSLDCYAYSCLASKASNKKLVKTWDYSLGESVLDVQTNFKGVVLIAVLTERNLYGFNENGSMVLAKRLEHTATAFCSFLTEEDKWMIVVATAENYINVYEESRLKWSMKIGQKAICIKRIFLEQLPGGLCLLSNDGLLQCIYLGTHPSVYLVPALSEPEIELLETESELERLQGQIRGTDATQDNPVLQIIDIIVMKPLKTIQCCPSCNILVRIKANSKVAMLQVLVHVEPPLLSSDVNTYLINFFGEASIQSTIQLAGRGTPSSLIASVVVSYVTGDGLGGCLLHEKILPLSLIAVEVNPLKEALHKLTFTVNKAVVATNRLFEDLIADKAPANNAMALRFLNSDDSVTVLAAKSTRKYRVQSDSIAAVTLPLAILVERLRQHGYSDLEATYCTPLPMEPYHEAIQAHHTLIIRRRNLEEKLAKECSQYRAIQKKILIAWKDASSKESRVFQKLLVDTFLSVAQTLDLLEGVERELEESRHIMTSLGRLLSILIQLSGVHLETLVLTRAIFNFWIRDDVDDQGWLETQEATCAFILRRVLTKSFGDEKNIQMNGGQEPMKGTAKFLKHLSAIVDKALRGTRILKLSESGKEKILDVGESCIPAGIKLINIAKSEHENMGKETARSRPKEFSGQSSNQDFENGRVRFKRNSKEGKKQEDKVIAGGTRVPDAEAEMSDGDGDDIWNVQIEEKKLL